MLNVLSFREFSTVLRDIPPMPTISAVMRLNHLEDDLDDDVDDQPGHVNLAFDSTDFEVVNNEEGEEEEEGIQSHSRPFSRSGYKQGSIFHIAD